MESEIQTKLENIELRGSGCRIIKYISMGVVLFERKRAKGASYVKLTIKNQAIVIIKTK